MAQRFTFLCDHCSKKITAWDDSDCYYIQANGSSMPFWHPQNPEPGCEVYCKTKYLCMDCGRTATIDSRSGMRPCTKCKGENLLFRAELRDKPCPFCKDGHFRVQPGICIS